MKKITGIFVSVLLGATLFGCTPATQENVVQPLARETLGLGDAALFAFAVDGAVLELSDDPGHKMFFKPYHLAGMQGYLSVSFSTDEADTEVTKDNARCRGVTFYMRGDSSFLAPVRESFQELGVKSWEGSTLTDVSQAKNNVQYFFYGFFEYEGAYYEGRIQYLAAPEEPPYIEEVENLLGNTWPEVSFSIVEWETIPYSEWNG